VQAALNRAAITAADTAETFGINRPEPPAAMVFENYTIRRRALEDTLTDTNLGETTRRSRRDI
jgi:hypothetical protein